MRITRCIRKNVSGAAKYLKNWGFFQGAAGDLICRHPEFVRLPRIKSTSDAKGVV